VGLSLKVSLTFLFPSYWHNVKLKRSESRPFPMCHEFGEFKPSGSHMLSYSETEILIVYFFLSHLILSSESSSCTDDYYETSLVTHAHQQPKLYYYMKFLSYMRWGEMERMEPLSVYYLDVKKLL